MHWRRTWQPTPVFFPGESQGWGSLVGCRLWGRTESDTTEATQQQQQQQQQMWFFPGSSAGKESACNAGDPGSVLGLGRFPGEGKGYPLQYSVLTVLAHGVAKSQTQLSDFHSFHDRCTCRFPYTFTCVMCHHLLPWPAY